MIPLLSGAKVYAQRKADTLGTVDVIGTAAPLNASSTTPGQVMTRSQLDAGNAVLVSDAVKRLSGVQVRDYGGMGGMKTVNIRNLGAAHGSVFYAGLPWMNTQNGQVDLSSFSLDNVEQIALFNGQVSDIFLPASTFSNASVLWITPRKSRFAAEQNSAVGAVFRMGSFGYLNPSLHFSRRLGRKTTLQVNSEWLDFNGEFPFHYRNQRFDTLLHRQNADLRSLRNEVSLQGELPDSSTWDLRFYQYYAKRGLPGATIANNFYRPDRQEDRNWIIQGGWKKKISDRYQIWLNARGQLFHQAYTDPVYPNERGRLENRYNERNLYISAAQQYRLFPSWSISFSTDYTYGQLEANLPLFTNPERHVVLNNLASEWREGRWRMQANLLHTYVGGSEKDIEGLSRLNPGFSASYQVDDDATWFIRAFAKKSFRLPTFNDLYYTVFGQSGLRPEYATQYNIGTNWGPDLGSVWRFTVQADAYYNRIQDQITGIPTANLFRWMMINLGEVSIKGLDVKTDISCILNDRISVSWLLNYSLQDARDVTPGSSTYGEFIPYAPLSSGNLSTGITFDNWQLNYHLLATDRRYSARNNLPVNDMPAWYVHDASIGRGFTVGRSAYYVLMEVNNVFSEDYHVIRNYPMPGRNYRITLRWDWQ